MSTANTSVPDGPTSWMTEERERLARGRVTINVPSDPTEMIYQARWALEQPPEDDQPGRMSQRLYRRGGSPLTPMINDDGSESLTPHTAHTLAELLCHRVLFYRVEHYEFPVPVSPPGWLVRQILAAPYLLDVPVAKRSS